MTFFPQPYYLDHDDMVKFILTIPTTGWTWRPAGVTWHNTGAPTLNEWLNVYSQSVRDAWGANYDHFCKVDQRWHSGPHFCGAPDKSIALCDPRANGVHSTCFNSDHFGVETIGDFRTGSDDPLTGKGLEAMQASATIIAALCKRMGWDDPRKVVNFHRMCTDDHHACPGNLVTDEWALSLVVAQLAALNGSPAPTPAPAPMPAPVVSPIAAAAAELEQAVKAFQRAAGLVIDGDPGPETRAAFEKTIAA